MRIYIQDMTFLMILPFMTEEMANIIKIPTYGHWLSSTRLQDPREDQLYDNLTIVGAF